MTKVRFFIIVLAILNGVSLSAQTVDDGFLLLKMGQLNKAQKVFSESLKVNNADYKTNFGMGEYYYENQKFDSAIIYYSAGAAANASNSLNYTGLGKTYLSLNKPLDAEKYFDLSRKLAKKDANVSAGIARAYISGSNNNFEACSNELAIARKTDHKTASIYLVEGLAALKKKDYSGAAGKFDQALFYDSLNVEAYLNNAKIFAGTAYKQSAIDMLNKVIRLVPNCYVAYRDLGNIYFDLAKYTDAQQAYEQYMAKADCSFEEKERYAYILFFNKNYTKALETVNELSNNNPENYIYLRLISYMNFETGEFAKGVDSFNKFFDKIPDSKTIGLDYEYYGKTLAALNMDSVATIAYQKAYNKDTTKMALIDEMAKLSLKQKKYTDAINYYSISISKKENPLPLDYFQLGRSYYLNANSLSNTLPLDSLAVISSAQQADTFFYKVCILNPKSYLGFIWRARANSLIDPESTHGLAKPHYEQTLVIVVENPAKYSKEIIEAYSYLGYYYYIKDDKTVSKEYWDKILAIDPTNEKALAASADLSK